jgi:hypothetical protein
MNSRLLFALPLALVLAGCAASPSAQPAAQKQVRLVPDERPYGRVATVNPQGQFVVVDFNVGTIPPLQAMLNVYRKHEVVGVIRLTGPVRDSLVAGDIVSGEPTVGDTAILDPDAGQASAEREP